MTRRRLDQELVRRGLVASRVSARRAIDEGLVVISGVPATKAATLVAPVDDIGIVSAEPGWAGRGALKLVAALDEFGVDPAGASALDVGASTGGFTDVLLARGAASVCAVDVGYGQLVWRLRTDPRVTVHDRTNFRTADVASLGGPFDLIVVDVSFISVTLLADNLALASRGGTDLVVLVKPQFEAGRDAVGRGGVVTDPAQRAAAVRRVAAALADRGLAPNAVVRSPITGAKGNVEILLHAVAAGQESLTEQSIEDAAS